MSVKNGHMENEHCEKNLNTCDTDSGRAEPVDIVTLLAAKTKRSSHHWRFFALDFITQF